MRGRFLGCSRGNSQFVSRRAQGLVLCTDFFVPLVKHLSRVAVLDCVEQRLQRVGLDFGIPEEKRGASWRDLFVPLRYN